MKFQAQSQKFTNEKNISELNNLNNKLKQEISDNSNSYQDKLKQFEKDNKNLQNEIIILKNQEEMKRE